MPERADPQPTFEHYHKNNMRPRQVSKETSSGAQTQNRSGHAEWVKRKNHSAISYNCKPKNGISTLSKDLRRRIFNSERLRLFFVRLAFFTDRFGRSAFPFSERGEPVNVAAPRKARGSRSWWRFETGIGSSPPLPAFFCVQHPLWIELPYRSGQ